MPTIRFADSFFDELLLNTLHSIDWQGFKVADLLKKESQRGKQNQKSKQSMPCQKIHSFYISNQLNSITSLPL